MRRRRIRPVFAAAAVIAAGAAAAVAVTGSSAAARALPLRLVPNTMAFLDASHGALGTGWQYAGHGGGTIALTSDGGRTWHVVRRTSRPVVSLTVYGNSYVAKYDDGETLRSARSGRAWRPTTPATTGPAYGSFSVCPQGTMIGINADSSNWSVCSTEPGAGNQGKAVYRDLVDRGWVRVACTDFGDTKAPCHGRGHGGISSYGYPIGIAGAADGFGLIWESRGTLYVSRDGGRHWSALAKLVQPEADFGSWAYTIPGGVGWALVGHGGGPWRLLRTTDAGRTWHVVHRWAAPRRY